MYNFIHDVFVSTIVVWFYSWRLHQTKTVVFICDAFIRQKYLSSFVAPSSSESVCLYLWRLYQTKAFVFICGAFIMRKRPFLFVSFHQTKTPVFIRESSSNKNVRFYSWRLRQTKTFVFICGVFVQRKHLFLFAMFSFSRKTKMKCIKHWYISR